MAESTYRTYDCTLRRFNKEISKNLSNTFGFPTNNCDEHGKTEGLSYFPSEDKEHRTVIRVRVNSEYHKENGIYYSINSRVQISLDTENSKIRKKLEDLLKEEKK
jgi:hypothetical protein